MDFATPSPGQTDNIRGTMDRSPSESDLSSLGQLGAAFSVARSFHQALPAHTHEKHEHHRHRHVLPAGTSAAAAQEKEGEPAGKYIQLLTAGVACSLRFVFGVALPCRVIRPFPPTHTSTTIITTMCCPLAHPQPPHSRGRGNHR